MHPRGWMTLGDIGHVDEDGFIFLTDRKSHMIISGGVNIYPQEIENLLVTHDKVMDAAVIGAPCPDFGEKVVAVIQPQGWSYDFQTLLRQLPPYRPPAARSRHSPVNSPGDTVGRAPAAAEAAGPKQAARCPSG